MTLIVRHNNMVAQGGIRGTVVSITRLTTGQQVERSIVRQGHDSQQNSSHWPRLSPAQYSITVQIRGLKHQSFISMVAQFSEN